MAFDLNEHEDVEKSVDRVGGDYFFDSGAHDCQIDMAYLEATKGGAGAFALTLVCGNKTHRETFYITSGKAKGQKNHYVDADGKKQFLPGFTLVSNLCKVVLGKNLEETNKSAEKKVINIYDWGQRKEVPTEKEFVFTELIGKSVKACIVKSIENKRKADSSGEYKPVNEKRTANYVSAFVNADTGLAAAEIEAKLDAPDFLPKWIEANEGVTRDNFKPVEGDVSSSGSGAKQEKLFS